MKTVIEIRDAIASGDATAEQVVKDCLAKIKSDDLKIGAFLETFDEEAIVSAQKIDQMHLNGDELPRLAGVPIAIKDNILMKGHTASAGSKMLKDYVAAYDSTVVKRLRDAGAIIIGRTNMDEFAMGSSTETSAFQKTRNPWDTNKVPGGSSGGSAAAVASGMVPAALGSDTGGSIRQPASLCGVVGMKPSYGRVSRYGLIAFASSFDQIGVFSSTVSDAALLLEVMEGKDEMDATSLNIEETTVAEIMSQSLEGIKIGVAKEHFVDGMDAGVREKVEDAIKVLKDHGAEIVDISLSLSEYALATYYVLSPAEASSNLSRFDGMRYGTRSDEENLLDSYFKARGEGFGKEVKRRIMLGNFILSAGYYDAYYKKAQAVKTAIFEEVNNAMKEVDVILSAVSPFVAWPMGEKFDDPIAMYLSDVLTITANMAQAPAISVPCGFVNGLPVGLQFMSSTQKDNKVLHVAHAYQSLTDFHEQRPD